MKIYLVDNKKINKYSLPSKVEEFFLINYKADLSTSESTITIEASNGKWMLRSNGSVNIMNGTVIVDSVIIEEYGFYYLKLSGQNVFLILFAMPSIETELYSLDARNIKEITIGSNQRCNISHLNMITADLQAKINMTEAGWVLTSGSKLKVGTYLNDSAVRSAKLFVGDMIFINGLKIIWMGDFFLINNPNNSVVVTGINAHDIESGINNTLYDPVSEEDQNAPQYKESDYFYHIPRIREMITEVEMKIDNPPSMQGNNELPFLLSIGTSLTMMASVLVQGMNIYSNITTGAKTWVQLVPQFITLGAMIVGSILMPRIISKYRKKMVEKRNALAEKKYKEYLTTRETKINQELQREANILIENNYDTKKCCELIMNNGRNLWSREIADDDFLTVRLGLGDKKSAIVVKASEEHFSVDENELLDMVHQLSDKAKKLTNVPITISLIEKKVAAFVFNCTYKDNYMDSIIAQIVALHSANDLKIVVLTDSNNEKRWEYIKCLPHAFSDDRTVRFFATTPDEYNSLDSYFETEFKNRKDILMGNNKDAGVEVDKQMGYRNFSPYYLIFTDNYQAIKNLPFVESILKSKGNLGFSFITIANSMKHLPNTCETFIEITENDSCVLEKELNASNQVRFKNEYLPRIDMNIIASKLANIPLHAKDGTATLPNMISFLDMFNVSKIEQFNILNRWKTNNPVSSIAAPVGVHANGEQFKLDLHEKFHGPHGLIAGMTGSGKSEFIITYILSMAVNYHPYEVNFVLIDYKGGGLAGAFENKETGVRIPHLTGTITNLDTSEMNRTLVSINSELKRRQRIFNEVRDSLGESTIDIYKYQRLYREGVVKEPMAHLFIISDEFAELKSQQPDFMDELISTARIGRSLGVHLILATQKPSGVVNDQIWSNSKFKVCLKVQDRSDSMEMLKKPDAASLRDVGRFYLQVGYDDYFALGQSAWCGAKYIPSDKIIKKIDDSLSFINNTGEVYKVSNDFVKKEVKNMGEQLTNVVRYINDLAKKENIKTKRLWLDAIPSEIFINNLKEKYDYKPQQYVITPVIGEYDNPKAQEQGLLTLDLTNEGNTVIYGQSGSGKENLISTILWSSIVEHTPSEISFYIIDCGAETLKSFANMPHVGAVLTIEDEEKIESLLSMVSTEIETRKALFSQYGGNYKSYLENSGKKLPMMVVVINNYDIFLESFDKLTEGLMPLCRDGAKYGVIFIISAISFTSIRARMAQSFMNKIALQLPDANDYRTYLGADRGLYPARIFGRGIIARHEGAVEFQTAYFCDPKQKTKILLAAAKQLNDAYKSRAKKVLVVPDIVTKNMVIDKVENLDKVPIGFSMKSKDVFYYDFTKNPVNTILSNLIGEKMNFINCLIDELAIITNVKLHIVDFINFYKKDKENVDVIKDSFEELTSTLVSSNNSGDEKRHVFMFLGIGQYKTKLSEIEKAKFEEFLAKINTYNNLTLIFVDNYKAFRSLQVESWYRTAVNTSSGIWLGEGVGAQMAIDLVDLSIEDRREDFLHMAFAVNQGKYTIIKCAIDSEEE